MNATDLIFELRNNGFSIIADGHYLDISPADVSPELVQQLKKNKAEILAALELEQLQETRRQKVLTLLEANPKLNRAVYVDTDGDQHNVILAIAIRGLATVEMLLPKANYDAWQLLALVDRADNLH